MKPPNFVEMQSLVGDGALALAILAILLVMIAATVPRQDLSKVMDVIEETVCTWRECTAWCTGLPMPCSLPV